MAFLYKQDDPATRMKALADQRNGLRVRIEEARAPVPGLHSNDPRPETVKMAQARLKSIAGETDAIFRALEESRIERGKQLRAFKLDHGVTRDAHRPDRMMTVIVASLAILAEGMMAGGLMIADGKVDVFMGGLYGLCIAALNVITGMTTGFFAGRYLGYRRNAETPKIGDSRKRLMAWVGFGLGLAAVGLLNFAAARTRATGSHQDIFNFSEIGLWATFSDYYAIAIMVLGAIGALLGIYKGWTGITDPIPGYEAMDRAADDEVSALAEDTRDRLIDAADAVFERAEDTILDVTEERDALTEEREALRLDLVHDIPALNDNIEAEKELRVREATRAHDRRGFVDGKPLPFRKPDLKPLERLKIPESQIPELLSPANDNGGSDALAALEAAYAETIAAIETGYGAFLVNACAPCIPIDE